MTRSAVLVGFQEQGNLGIGYVASTLMQRGFSVVIRDFRERPEEILAAIRAADPALVGFSLIFQYYAPQFRALARYLRANGVLCHFCAGGHYPTLRYARVLDDIPELDSIVRFEGELTIVELMERLTGGRDWKDVLGIAYRQGSTAIANPPHPLIADLDELPFPARPFDSVLTALGRKASPLLASRGCCRTCSFCSIRQFYSGAPGKQVRVRRPERVVDEMKALYEHGGVSIFLFQDDDFPVWGEFGRRWSMQFVDSLRRSGLLGRVIWKISCRSDEVEPQLFSQLREAGLFMVYLGIESGNEAGLRVLNKQIEVEDNLRAVRVLGELNLATAYGFMMFDPSSTFDSVRANIAFLQQITADNRMPVTFCRMLPYAGTPIEESLVREGRLRGSIENPDYTFLVPRLNRCFEELYRVTSHWIDGSDALLAQINFAWLEYWVMRRLFPPLKGMDEYETDLRSLTRDSNCYLLDLAGHFFRVFDDDAGRIPAVGEVAAVSKRFARELVRRRNAHVLCNQDTILAALQDASVRREPDAAEPAEPVPA